MMKIHMKGLRLTTTGKQVQITQSHYFHNTALLLHFANRFDYLEAFVSQLWGYLSLLFVILDFIVLKAGKNSCVVLLDISVLLAQSTHYHAA